MERDDPGYRGQAGYTPFLLARLSATVDHLTGMEGWTAGKVLPGGNPQVARDGALVSGNHLPLNLYVPLAPVPHRVTPSRRLELDDFGSRHGARDDVADVEAAERPDRVIESREHQLARGHVGLEDAFVLKLSANSSALLYSTYLGGSVADRGGRGCGLRRLRLTEPAPRPRPP